MDDVNIPISFLVDAGNFDQDSDIDNQIEEELRNHDLYINTYLRSNRQISGNLRSFLHNYFNEGTDHGSRRTSSHIGSPSRHILGTLPSYTSNVLSVSIPQTLIIPHTPLHHNRNGIQDINRVSTLVEDFNKKNEDDSICVICQDYLKNKEKIRRLLCFHMFCESCISKWLEKHRNCPICQTKLLEEECLKI